MLYFILGHEKKLAKILPQHQRQRIHGPKYYMKEKEPNIIIANNNIILNAHVQKTKHNNKKEVV